MPIQDIFLGNEGSIYWDADTPLGPTDENGAPDLARTEMTPQEYDEWLLAANATNYPGDNVMDVSLQIDSDFADSTTRIEARTGWASEIAVLNSGRVTFDVRWDASNAFGDALIAAWKDRQGISMAFMEQRCFASTLSGEWPTAGVSGLIGHFSVSYNKEEALRDIQKASFTIAIAKYPAWHTTAEQPA